jgi:hypothetical protein
LIIGIDQEGPWVVEGSHRFDALLLLGKESFPAIVVLDLEALGLSERHASPIHPGTGTDQSVHDPKGYQSIGGTVFMLKKKAFRDLMNIPKTERWEWIRRAADAIDKVHYFGPGMPKLPLKVSKAKRTSGTYWYLVETGEPQKMMVVLYGGHKEYENFIEAVSLVHETGHFIDHMMFGNKREFASPEIDKLTDTGTFDEAEPFQTWRAAIMNSRAYRELRDWKQTGQIQATHVDGTVGYKYYSTSAARKGMRTIEFFARSYTQWIAMRSREPSLMRGIEDRLRFQRAGTPALHWEWKDFEPIADAMDEIFRSKGWLKE